MTLKCWTLTILDDCVLEAAIWFTGPFGVPRSEFSAGQVLHLPFPWSAPPDGTHTGGAEIGRTILICIVLTDRMRNRWRFSPDQSTCVFIRP